MGVTLPVEGRGGKEMQTSFSFVSIYPRAWQQQRGRDRKEMQTSCSNVLMFPCTPTMQDTWVIDSIFGTPIAPSSSWYSLDVFLHNTIPTLVNRKSSRILFAGC